MPAIPNPFDDFFEAAGSALEDAQEFFNGSQTPSTIGYGTRQSKLPNNRQAESKRNIIHWVVPEGPIIQMYINPQNIQTGYVKDIPVSRTKGGFVGQYFGPQLSSLRISGTTGTSGIEGINVLYDLYRYEQLAFDPYALYMASQTSQQLASGNVFGEDSALSAGAEFVDALIAGNESVVPTANILPPTLADMAFRIEMFYSGEVYRGFFTNFDVTESSDNIGMFNYNLSFTVTQKRGFRQNFFAWHRSANDGPSNSNPQNGVPYSYSSLVTK